MTILPTLPAAWPLQPGEKPTPAAEGAAALLELATDARDDAQAMLAQLGAAPDATPAAIELAIRLQQLLAEAVELAVALAVET